METNMNKPNNNRADRGKNRKSGNVKPSPEEQRRILARQLGIKEKTREFIDLMNDNPKLSATEAYIRTHSTTNRITAGTAASKLLKKPSVIGYKDSAVKKAKRRIVTLIESDNESIALKAAQDVIDRNEGKSVQKTENLSRVVEVKLDLSGARIGAHFINSPNVPLVEE